MELLGWMLLFGVAAAAVVFTALLIWRVFEMRRERREMRELRAIVRRYE